MGYFRGRGRVQKLFWGFLISTNNFFQSFALFLLYHVVLSLWWWVVGCGGGRSHQLQLQLQLQIQIHIASVEISKQPYALLTNLILHIGPRVLGSLTR